MTEGVLIALALLGIFLIGLLFAAADIVKGFVRFFFIGLLIFGIILLLNRRLPSIDFGDSLSRGDSPNGDIIEPLEEDEPSSEFSDYLENLAEDLEEFVSGPDDQLGQSPETQDDLIYELPPGFSDRGTVAEQPRSTDVSPSTRSTNVPGQWDHKPIPAMW